MSSVIASILERLQAAKDLPLEFENLKPGTFEIKSRWSGIYNCIAFAANEDHRKWWPVPMEEGRNDRYWPEGAPLAERVASFVRAFEIEQEYQLCTNYDLEEGVEKVVIYARGIKPTHMARQLPDGKWASKLGDKEDIHHNTVHEVEGKQYGTVAKVLCRKVIREEENDQGTAVNHELPSL